MGALFRQASIIDDPGSNRAGVGHRRQRIVDTEQGLIAPRSIGHHMMQRLVHAPDVLRSQPRRHRLDRLPLSRQQQPGAIQLERNSTIGVRGF
jgi:hypothetical protein